eukprot:scaffold281612_cov23-Attheya_sp.AAC.1
MSISDAMKKSNSGGGGGGGGKNQKEKESQNAKAKKWGIDIDKFRLSQAGRRRLGQYLANVILGVVFLGGCRPSNVHHASTADGASYSAVRGIEDVSPQ